MVLSRVCWASSMRGTSVAPARQAGDSKEAEDDAVETWRARVPALRPQVVPQTNHYTILFDREGAAAVSQAIRAAAL